MKNSKCKIKELTAKISKWIKDCVDEGGADGVVLGLSGGVDSSVVAVLSKFALGECVLGLIMPCYSEMSDEEDAMLVAKKFDIRTERVVLDSIYDRLIEIIPQTGRSSVKDKVCLANLKARLRMVTLYYFANKLNYLVAGCGNKSELITGYFTKYGDGGVDILPLGGLLKTEVIELAKELKIQDKIILKPPSAGLWQGQTDEVELGISYTELDKAILAIETGKEMGVDSRIISKVKKLIQSSEHKRLPIPIFKIEKG
ncbi:MAG: NAD+ synthase [bacterium]|nr:NAD+ synthase [bacterium]